MVLGINIGLFDFHVNSLTICNERISLSCQSEGLRSCERPLHCHGKAKHVSQVFAARLHSINLGEC